MADWIFPASSKCWPMSKRCEDGFSLMPCSPMIGLPSEWQCAAAMHEVVWLGRSAFGTAWGSVDASAPGDVYSYRTQVDVREVRNERHGHLVQQVPDFHPQGRARRAALAGRAG